jgi:predicted nucleic acid-binding protein
MHHGVYGNPTQIYLTDDQRARLTERASREGVPVSQLVRDAIDALLESEDDLEATFGAAPGSRPTAVGSWLIRRLLAGMEEIVVDRRVADRAGRIRGELPKIRMPDALIAATALVHSLTLSTKNVRDFRDVKGLRLR